MPTEKRPRKVPAPIPRILIIEDDPDRQERLRGWCIPGLQPVVVGGAGRALGLLPRDGGSGLLAGILLDHDLDRNEPGSRFNGHDVAAAIARHVPPHVPVLVHSASPQGAARIASLLQAANFNVERIPIAQLSRERLQEWLQEALESWDAVQGEGA